ncbi:hypothetical protein [Streptomyces acidiscabies]|uniref:hypothetical protein n=1 Tax=Streptomyces acidiscabies TaxID=42234 RepID=UPI0038F668A2
MGAYRAGARRVLTDEGGWTSPTALDRFTWYVERACAILHDVAWGCTISEPNILAMMSGMATAVAEGADLRTGPLWPSCASTRRRTSAGRWRSRPPFPELRWAWEDLYHHGARGDDFLGVQAYTSQLVSRDGIAPESPDNTLTGWAYRPDALGIATADETRRIAYATEALGHLGS